jgi:hypothetical protein
MKKTDFKR